MTPASARKWLCPLGVLAAIGVALAACTNGGTAAPPVPTERTATHTQITPAQVASATASPIPDEGSASAKPLQSPATPVGAPAPARPAAAYFADAPERDLYQLAAELTEAGRGEISRVVNPAPVSYTEGRRDTFWLVDLPDLKVYQSQFELRLVTPHAYWYVEEGQSIRQADIERSAAVFEEEIYPRVTAVFGAEWSPGVDNDPHLNILNARLRGVGGYYSSSDQYPASVSKNSNQREIIYVNSGATPIGSQGYLEVLAHELQHAVHWNADPSEETWVNEGLSEFAASMTGLGSGGFRRFLRSRPTSLVHWPLDPFDSGANYGAASLFMHYLVEHYGDPNDLRPLLREQEDGINGINSYLRTLGHDVTFREVFRDWAVSNLLDESEGLFGYAELEVRAAVSKSVDRFSELKSEIPQYAVEYIGLDSFKRPLRLRFQAPVETSLLPTEVGPQGCWWSNAGDSINSTLTRTVDLRGLEGATLSYQVWYNLEKNWDYAYLEVSTDGGRSWDILQTAHTSPENPIGNSFGMGYTGASDGWVDESVDLGAYAGRQILLRFQYVTDDAVNGSGLCVQQIAIPEAGLLEGTDGWQARGFVLTDNRVRQDYLVQVIEMAETNRVTLMQLDQANLGELIVPAPQTLDRLVVAVAALAPNTRQPAPYTLTVGPAE